MGVTLELLRLPMAEAERYKIDYEGLEELTGQLNEKVDPRITNVDKSWDGIYFLLTGHSYWDDTPVLHPWEWVLGGHTRLHSDHFPDEYHILLPEQVKEVALALSKIDESEFRSRYDGKLMIEKKVYRGGSDLEYYVWGFKELKAIYTEAAARGEALITSFG